MYVQPFPPTLTPVLLFAPLQLCSQRNYSELEKYWRGHLRLPPSVTPMYVINALSLFYILRFFEPCIMIELSN